MCPVSASLMQVLIQDIFLCFLFPELYNCYGCKAKDWDKFGNAAKSFIPIYILKWITSLPAEDFFQVSSTVADKCYC